MAFLAIVVLIGAVCGLRAWMKQQEAKERRQRLLAQYGDPELVDRIIARTVWQGETPEQLRESLGAPEDVDQKVMKSKKREVWKCGGEGGNRYRLRITLEDDVVVGWDER